MKRNDLIHQLGALTSQLQPVLLPTVGVEHLKALCATARLAFGAAAVSVAARHDDVLLFVAAAGTGAEAIVGTELSISRGIAGYVALTGQSLAVDRPANDPRFARDVAERTGLVPVSILAVPVTGEDGEVTGVLSVLDRSLATGDALELATAVADQVGLLLPTLDVTGRAARVLLDAVIDAASRSDAELGTALQRATSRLSGVDAELATIAATIARLQAADPAVRSQALSVIADVVALATARRRR
jgi:signal transduction protein with GAF and PtsI domain